MTFKQLRQASGMTITQFSEYFGIPRRTVEDWNAEKRSCSQYLIDLMQYKLKKEGVIDEIDNITG